MFKSQRWIAVVGGALTLVAAGQSPAPTAPAPAAPAPTAPAPTAPAAGQPAKVPEVPDQAMKEEDLGRLIEAEQPALEARLARIEAEVAAQAKDAPEWFKEWAGRYYTGDGMGMNVIIDLAPKAGLTYIWRGCTGLYDANHGDVVESFPGGIKVKLAIRPAASRYRFMSETLYFVRWGPRRYLVPGSQMMKLVNNYNEGGYSRERMRNIPRRIESDGDYVPRLEPEPEGVPELPPEFSKLLLTKPLALSVTKVTAEPVHTVTGAVECLGAEIEFSGGQEIGVAKGMTFHWGSLLGRGTIFITRVDAKTCTGRFMAFGHAEELRTPPVGAVVRLPEPPLELPGQPKQPGQPGLGAPAGK